MANAAKGFARTHLIDPLSNLPKRRVYVFSGTEDNIVRPTAIKEVRSAYWVAVNARLHRLER